MNVRAGDTTSTTCGECHRHNENEKIALRLRIAVLESQLERKTEALHRLMVFFEQSEKTPDRPLTDDLDDFRLHQDADQP